MQSITLQTNDTVITSGDVLGRLNYAASAETDGSAAILIAGSVFVQAEGSFQSAANPASIVFATAAADSSAAAGRLKVTDGGHFIPLADNTYDVGDPNFNFRNVYTKGLSINDYSFPSSDGSANQVLQTDGAGTLSFADSSGSSEGTPSGIGFFDDAGSLSGNINLIYDGFDVSLSGNIIASGKRAITSEEIYHIKQLTQSEYDAISPDAATFYIITDPDVEGPVVQPYREVSSSDSILTTDYTINATAGLVLSLPTAVGNGGTIFNIKSTTDGTVIVSGVSSQTIDGEPSYEISTQYQSIKVQSTNSNWVIL